MCPQRWSITRWPRRDSKAGTLAAKGVRPKFIYEIPDFQNPSGITMTLKRRQELLRIAEKFDLVIVEDSPYRQLRFEGKTEPSLLGMNSDRVLGLYTFSKILLPGRRQALVRHREEHVVFLHDVTIKETDIFPRVSHKLLGCRVVAAFHLFQ